MRKPWPTLDDMLSEHSRLLYERARHTAFLRDASFRTRSCAAQLAVDNNASRRCSADAVVPPTESCLIKTLERRFDANFDASWANRDPDPIKCVLLADAPQTLIGVVLSEDRGILQRRP